MLRGLFDRSWSKRATRSAPSRAIGTVRQGKRYRATVNLSWVESMAASNEMIAEKLEEAGFTEVKVKGSGAKRIAEALWPGPDRSGEIDPHLSEIKEIA
jgi:hypothetical protein